MANNRPLCRTFLALALLAEMSPARAGWRVDGLAPLTRSGQAIAPIVAPDGRRVAYLVGSRLQIPGALDVLSGRLWVMDRASGEAQRLGKLSVDAVQGEQTVVFAAGGGYAYTEGPRSAPVLWYVGPDGNRFRVGAGRGASFGPDGRYLAYIVWDRSGAPVSELWLFGTETHESKRLAHVTARGPLQSADAPRWTPDGSRIVFRVENDLYSYNRFTGRLDNVSRTGDVRGFDVGLSGTVLYMRQGGPQGTAGFWTARPDGRLPLLALGADELPPDITDVTFGPDAQTAFFIASTAAGRGLVTADLRSARWRFLSAADAYARQPGGTVLALETTSAPGKRNIVLGRLVPAPDRAINALERPVMAPNRAISPLARPVPVTRLTSHPGVNGASTSR